MLNKIKLVERLAKQNSKLKEENVGLNKRINHAERMVSILEQKSNRLSTENEFKDNRIKELEDDKKDLNKQLAEKRKYPEITTLRLDDAYIERVRIFEVNANSKKEVSDFQKELDKYVQKGNLSRIDQLSLGNGKVSYIVIYQEKIGK